MPPKFRQKCSRELGFFNPKLKQNSTTVTYYSMYTQEGNGFPSLPSTKVAHSLSHSPLPVLSIYELHGSIRHSGAILPESQIKKKLSTTNVLPQNFTEKKI